MTVFEGFKEWQTWLSLSLLLTAHVLRALKFWLIVGLGHLSLRKTFLIFYSTSLLGFFIPTAATELMRFFLMFFLISNFTLLTISYFINRSLDVVVLSALAIFLSKTQNASAGSFGGMLPVVLLLASLLVFGGLFSIANLTVPTQEFLLRSWHSSFGVSVLKLSSRLGQTTQAILSRWPRSLVVPLFLTLTVWAIDIVAVSFVFPSFAINAVAGDWIHQSFMSLTSGKTRWVVMQQLGQTYQRLIIPQIVLFTCLIGTSCLVNFKKTKLTGPYEKKSNN